MSGRALVGVVVLAVLAVSNTITVAQTAPKLDYEFFKRLSCREQQRIPPREAFTRRTFLDGGTIAP
jgi:uncharacterized protein (DUF2342 family)